MYWQVADANSAFGISSFTASAGGADVGSKVMVYTDTACTAASSPSADACKINGLQVYRVTLTPANDNVRSIKVSAGGVCA